jgi:mannose-6-phosphate isomerase
MTLNEPIIFEPLFMERVWGGRTMEAVFHKNLPPATSIGESWEIVDRPEAQSLVHHGPLKGKTLHDLWQHHRQEIFGENLSVDDGDGERFPLLIKILDAQEKLSVQVHPPRHKAHKLGGEPKTEMWYIVRAGGTADLYVGLKKGVGREEFQRAIKEGTVAEKIHRVETHNGDAMFLPSGRLHAIGAGNLIFEIQQNSDTTYRVFDWNRSGLDGKPRELHIDESLASIDFDDEEPGLLDPSGEVLVECDYFRTERWELHRPRAATDGQRFAIIACVQGRLACGQETFEPGQFFLVPRCMEEPQLRPLSESCVILHVSIPN